jgi:nicotinamide mononucleotide transporter
LLHWFFFEVLGYSVSYLEFISVCFGLLAVYLAAVENIFTWPLGLVNISSAFLLFYRVQLYSDMFLQIYFFSISIYGWYYWKKEKTAHLPLKYLSYFEKLKVIIIIMLGTFVFGWFIQDIHLYFPSLFPEPAAYPYADTFIAVASIVANTLLARRVIENWIIWIVVDVLCVFLYFDKNIKFIALEYFIFLGLASYGLMSWRKLYLQQTKTVAAV